MDLLLAHGYFLAEDAEEQRIMRPHPPLGLLYLSSHLKARGVDVGVFDSTFQRLGDFEHCLRRERPPVVGIAVNLMTKRNALRMMARRASGRRAGRGRWARSAALRRRVPRTPAPTWSSLAKASRRSRSCFRCC